ncbi:MAG: hypothetical protein V4703_11315 [Actinomycetota bacterium]
MDSPVLDRATWSDRERAHHERADTLTAAHRERAARGEKHPIWDFLFTYYSYSPSQLRRWHPGAGVQLEDAANRVQWRWYSPGSAPGSVAPDAAAFAREKAALADLIERMLRRTAALPPVWARMQEVELEVPFALLYGKALADLALSGEAAGIAFRVALLAPQYETFAQSRTPANLTEAFLIAIAKGKVRGVTAPDSLGRAIAAAFTTPVPSAEAKALMDGNRTGEAILVAIENIGRGVQGDLRGVSEGLSLLRLVGLEDVARRTAIELMILERRG